LDGWGSQEPSQIVDEMGMNYPHPSEEQREQMSWMARAGEEDGDKGLGKFYPS